MCERQQRRLHHRSDRLAPRVTCSTVPRYSHGMTDFIARLQAVRARIAAACQHSGRAPSQVHLLAVSKTFDADAVRSLARIGQRDFGENYIQEGVDKITQLQSDTDPPPLVWHCIGPVQSNKTRLVAAHFDWVHTLDRLKIAQRLHDQRPLHLPPLNVCIQVNLDGGRTKSGVAPEAVAPLARALRGLTRLRLRGLMTLPDPVEGFEAQVALHRRARVLFEQLRATLDQPEFDTLSMGMSADLEAAIHAGSTMVRIGTALFGERTRSR